MNIEWIVAPLSGALIGYITNALAIKMLFRPAKPLYIKGRRVPFTPGLIPKEKARLAESIGNVVGEVLLDESAIADALLGEAALQRVHQGIGAALQKHAASPDSLRAYLSRFVSPDQADLRIGQGTDYVKNYLASRLKEANLGQTTAQSVLESVKRRTPGPLGDAFRNMVGEKLVEQLSQTVNSYVDRHADQIISGAIDREAARLMDTPVCELVAAYQDRLPELTERLTGLYARLVRDNLPKALAAIDLSGIARSRVMAIPDEELERTVNEVVGRELNAIVYLGAALGLVMGFVNLLF